MTPPPPIDKEQAEALIQVLNQNDMELGDFLKAIQVTAEAKKRAGKVLDIDDEGMNVYGNKEYLFHGYKDAFIYQNLKTQGRNYYLRVKEKGKPPLVKSLGTSNREDALVAGKMLYQETKSKILRGEKSRSINSEQLMKKYMERERKKITDTPQEGLTQKSYESKEDYLKVWWQFIQYKKLEKKPIEQINIDIGKEFPYWIKEKKEKKAYKDRPYSNEYINAVSSEVKYMYFDYALKNRYTSPQNIPQFERLKIQKNLVHKRDVLEAKEWVAITRYLRSNKYLKGNVISISGEDTGNKIDETEKLKRQIARHYFLLAHSLGTRSKELLGITFNDVYLNPLDNRELQKEHRLVKIKASNAKTGKEREINAPIGRWMERLKEIYESAGMEVQPHHYLFRNVCQTVREENVPWQQPALTKRWKNILKWSGIKEQLDATGRTIQLYNSRHFYICMRLMCNTPIYDIALNCGTSVYYIENTYSSVISRLKTESITRGMSILKTLEKCD